MQTLKLGELKCVAPTGDVCGEGILWSHSTQCIYWSDINRFLVHRYGLEEGTVKTWQFSEPVTCVLDTTREDTLALSLGSGIALWQPASTQPLTPVFALPGWPSVRCNDAAVDPSGCLWVGSMRNNVQPSGAAVHADGSDGALYRVEGNGASSQWRAGVGIANTLLWSPDQSLFYFGDSTANCIWSYQYSLDTRAIGSERVFFKDFERGKPDGSTIDREGYLWNCRYDGSCIVRIAPDGSVDRVIELPVTRPTNCTFGGPEGNILYITSASPHAGHWERFGGGLFALETNITGLPESKFQLP